MARALRSRPGVVCDDVPVMEEPVPRRRGRRPMRSWSAVQSLWQVRPRRGASIR